MSAYLLKVFTRDDIVKAEDRFARVKPKEANGNAKALLLYILNVLNMKRRDYKNAPEGNPKLWLRFKISDFMKKLKKSRATVFRYVGALVAAGFITVHKVDGKNCYEVHESFIKSTRPVEVQHDLFGNETVTGNKLASDAGLIFAPTGSHSETPGVSHCGAEGLSDHHPSLLVSSPFISNPVSASPPERNTSQPAEEERAIQWEAESLTSTILRKAGQGVRTLKTGIGHLWMTQIAAKLKTNGVTTTASQIRECVESDRFDPSWNHWQLFQELGLQRQPTNQRTSVSRERTRSIMRAHGMEVD